MNPTAEFQSAAKPFGGDSTVRWSCRRGEYVLWVTTDSFVTADRLASWTVQDFWQMRDGDYLTITNRWVDLPAWFELHPLEVAGRAVWEMQKRLDSGYKPKEVMDGPNLWRVKAGDRLFWVTDVVSANPVKELLHFRACALVLGENASTPSAGPIFFGAPESQELPAAAAKAMRASFDMVVGLGVPREFAPEWRFGA